ncbi:MAG: putative sulfate exporter family transporter, partial [Gammaproteobacteria bacterium]
TTERTAIIIPWFALGFVAVSGINSLQIIPAQIADALIQFDIFLLTMAMMALGMETNLKKFKTIGWKPVLLAGGLFIYLLLAGYGLVALIPEPA